MRESAASGDPKDAQIEVLNGKLTGEKLFVPDALVADAIVVVARNGVFVADAKDSGIKTAAMPAMDLTRKLYSVRFDSVPAEKLGNADGLARGWMWRLPAWWGKWAAGCSGPLTTPVDMRRPGSHIV